MNQSQRRSKLLHARLYGIVDFGYVSDADVFTVTRQLLAGGADVIQLRAKGVEMERIIRASEKIVPLCKAAWIPFVLNDFPDLAIELGADGVHIGQDDGVLGEVRRLVGEQMLIGRSTHSLDQARQALAEGADYIGFGPLFPTPTKAGRPSIGLRDIAEMEKDVGSQIAAFCIGGINRENLPHVLSAGGRRCVIVSKLLTAKDVAKATADAREAIVSGGCVER